MEKVTFIIQVKGDSSVGDFPYETEATLMNDGRDLEEFIEQAKQVLKDLYCQEYGGNIYTEEEFDDLIEAEVSFLENNQLREF